MSASVNKQRILTSHLSRSNPSGWSAFCIYWGLIIGSIFLCLNLTGCAAPLLALGSSATSVASSAGTAAVSVAAANPSTAASAISTATTGKSPLEHAASAATKQDCNFLNALGPKPICSDIPVPTIKDMSEPYPGPADSLTTSK
ncbi:MAG: hypothetical protein B7Y05_00625 [Polynucleobacter sp. 24-46-87]|uniref:hypothetical protein n=1 Tax=unclassified Polynucleobacter TaxID=2640945 RepID=UPI000BD5A6DC|nr:MULTISPECIES: hypothetical protein [unclassified Polynucleobacter]OYY19450.1 MAG: hypothetical protein B7Y67_05695 [Polynucleobacter sp. 35-46-11]OZA16288.1 MAG: hypothetical protein B7Y05_00625 [Polynucleobacter sp. 24-46-87]OZA78142.1 MAG: hypothetical protein B7X71_02190 [Polynucleobacter sp. 39-46-10]